MMLFEVARMSAAISGIGLSTWKPACRLRSCGLQFSSGDQVRMPFMTGRDAMRLTLPRMKLAAVLAALCAVAGPTAAAERPPVVHHDLAVTLDPANHRLKVHDRIRIPGALVTGPLTIA